MTRQESFKRRIRLRMDKTGERYAAARSALLEQSSNGNGSTARTWVAPPEMSDDAVRAATGKGWNEWCDIIEAWPGHVDGHPAIAAYLQEELKVDMWWSQSVTVGFERITGLRLPYQRADGTFTAGKSRTMAIDVGLLRSMLLDDEGRLALFPGYSTELRSRPGSKVIRITIGSGVAEFGFEAKSDGRYKVGVSHEGLPTFDDVERWKFYWNEWLDAIDHSVEPLNN